MRTATIISKLVTTTKIKMHTGKFHKYKPEKQRKKNKTKKTSTDSISD